MQKEMSYSTLKRIPVSYTLIALMKKEAPVNSEIFLNLILDNFNTFWRALRSI